MILGVFALVLVMGGFYVVGKSNASRLVAATARPAGSVAVAAAPVAAGGGSDKLLEAMKDELFHLEIDRQQGKITQTEYEKTKAALDETIKRALARAKA